jgi:hypothetical protein
VRYKRRQSVSQGGSCFRRFLLSFFFPFSLFPSEQLHYTIMITESQHFFKNFLRPKV